MMHNFDFDFLVIGAGSGGARASRIAAAHGAKVALVERGHMGGTCVNVGCVPKKLFAYASHFHDDFDDSEGFGWDWTTDSNQSVDRPVHNWRKLIEQKEKELARLRGFYVSAQKHSHVIEGEASFVDNHTVSVNGQTFTADKILIAVGGKPFVPDIEGKEHMLISDDMFYLNTLPARAAVYGGGYIATEFACILNGLGVKTDLIYRGDLFLRGFDHDIRQHMVEELMKHGVNLHFNFNIDRVEKKGNVLKAIGSNGNTIETDMILAATGRVPLLDPLKIENTGVELAKNGLIAVNDVYQTSQDNIYAVGDCSSVSQLTPVAINEGHFLADMLFGPDNMKKRGKPLYNIIPTAVFTSPPIGTLGVTEEQAVKEYGVDNIVIYKSSFRPMKHTLSGRDTRTLMKLIVKKDTDQVIGLHMAGDDTPEILQGFAVAMAMGAKKSDFDRVTGIHPTAAEELVTMRDPLPPSITSN